MTNVLYAHIHGFNSSPASRTLRLLREHFPEVQGLAYDSAGHFAQNMALLRRQMEDLGAREGRPLLLSGSSLGGFYASQLAAHFHCPAVLFNPVVYPHLALHPALGRQVHYYTGEEWLFTPEALQSYADFTDVRGHTLPHFVLLGKRDTVLNPKDAEDYWQDHALIHHTEDEHSIATLDEVTLQALTGLMAT